MTTAVGANPVEPKAFGAATSWLGADEIVPVEDGVDGWPLIVGVDMGAGAGAAGAGAAGAGVGVVEAFGVPPAAVGVVGEG